MAFGRSVSPATRLVRALALTAIAMGRAAFADDPLPNPCNQVGPGAGCADQTCALLVCQYNPDCCEHVWDQSCVDQANLLCSGCEVNLQDCRVPHVLGGCAESECCATVCGIDPYCCEVSWDGTCVIYTTFCPPPAPLECGDPEAGLCTTVHGTPSCSDKSCCDVICALPAATYCCEESWDQLCVDLARDICSAACLGSSPPNAIDEQEICDQGDTNDPGILDPQKQGAPQPLPTPAAVLNGTIHGSGTQDSTDIDVYALDLTQADTDQDGLVKVRLSVKAAVQMFAAVVPSGTLAAGLPAAPVLVSAPPCDMKQQYACIPPGTYWVVVSLGTDGVVGSPELFCSSPRSAYRIWVQVEADCAAPCGNSSDSCFVPHAGTSCADASCCAQVCASLPTCCDTGWDMTCVQEAGDLCQIPQPANDPCTSAAPVSTGDVPFTLFGASLDPTGDFACRINSTTSGADVWFAWQPAFAGAYRLSICDVEFDSRLAVYGGSCGSLSQLACNDNSGACQPNTNGSQTTVSVNCGDTYLIRVGCATGQPGAGTLRITQVVAGPACAAPCAADLDGSLAVDFGDVALAMLDFGPCAGCPSDLDQTESVDFGDIALILLESGPCP